MNASMLSRAFLMSVLCVLAIGGVATASYIEEEFGSSPPTRPPEIIRPIPPAPIIRPPTHVQELADVLDRLELRRPAVYGRLAVFPVSIRGGEPLGGRWLTMDAALSRGDLVVTEKGGGSVPVVWMENRSRDRNILIVAGEVISGGKQTRTVRQDVVLAPGQSVEISVFCVEHHRWEGGGGFKAAGAMAPSSIQGEMRGGADQAKVWAEVDRNNEALGTQNPTASLADGIQSPAVQRELEGCRRAIMPDCPGDAVGYIFVDRLRGRAVGAELFGSSDLARAMLSKLIDAYAVDMVVAGREKSDRYSSVGDSAAQDILRRMRQAGSSRVATPGSGAGIEMRGQGLTGTGVGMGGDLVHFGAQSQADIVVPTPRPRPVPMPRPMPYAE
jgi:hypothetical protein